MSSGRTDPPDLMPQRYRSTSRQPRRATHRRDPVLVAGRCGAENESPDLGNPIRGKLVGEHLNAEHCGRGSPPNDPIRRYHRAPPSRNLVVRATSLASAIGRPWSPAQPGDGVRERAARRLEAATLIDLVRTVTSQEVRALVPSAGGGAPRDATDGGAERQSLRGGYASGRPPAPGGSRRPAADRLSGSGSDGEVAQDLLAVVVDLARWRRGGDRHRDAEVAEGHIIGERHPWFPGYRLERRGLH
jgi:hypothetical protein